MGAATGGATGEPYESPELPEMAGAAGAPYESPEGAGDPIAGAAGAPYESPDPIVGALGDP